MRNSMDNLSDGVLANIFPTSSPGPCATTNVSVAARGASSPTPINVRSFHRLSSASSMIAGGRAIATSPTSLMNDPPCPSCPSPLKNF
jgi:hypothetical protein